MEQTADLLIHRDDTVLLVIDVQERLLPFISGAEAVVRNTAKLCHFARITGLPVLWAEQDKLGPTPEEIRQALGEAQPFRKTEFGALANEAFSRALNATGRGTLVLAGIEAHICVAQTALQALPRYRVHIAADAIGSRAPENREIALQRLDKAGAVITSTEMAMYELLEKAGTDEFRRVLPLVK